VVFLGFIGWVFWVVFYCQPWSKAAVAAAALDVSLFQTETTSTAAAASLRDMLDKANLNWDNYLGSPIGMNIYFLFVR
jgi:hypothetical protein